jgi:hypothetical protein
VQIFGTMRSMPTSARCAAILIAVFLSGCYTTTAVRAPGAPVYTPVRMEDVQAFPSLNNVPAHEVIGMVAVEGEAGYLRTSAALAHLRKRAAELGAHAIVIQEMTFPEGIANTVSSLVPGIVRRRTTALAIRYKEDNK